MSYNPDLYDAYYNTLFKSFCSTEQGGILKTLADMMYHNRISYEAGYEILTAILKNDMLDKAPLMKCEENPVKPEIYRSLIIVGMDYEDFIPVAAKEALDKEIKEIRALETV